MSVFKESSPRILDLPMELVKWIVEDLGGGPRGLLRLRQTCKIICTKTQDLLTRKYFSDRAFFIGNEQSLHDLFEVSRHPVFAKSMQRVELSLTRLPEPPKTELPDRPTMTQQERSKQRPQQRRQHANLIREDQDFRARGSGLNYLLSIFANFKTAGNVPAIVATGEGFRFEGDITSVGGYRRWHRQMGLDRGVEVSPTSDRSYEIIYHAICKTGCPITSLELGHSDFGVPPGMLALCIPGEPYANLRCLRLILAPVAYRSSTSTTMTERNRSQRKLSFIRFFQQAGNLETLALGAEEEHNVPSGDHNTMFDVLGNAVRRPAESGRAPFQRLRILELDRQQVVFADLLRFLRATRTTLKLLKMTSTGCWAPRPTNGMQHIYDANGREDFEPEIHHCSGFYWWMHPVTN